MMTEKRCQQIGLIFTRHAAVRMTLKDVAVELVCGTIGGSVGCVFGHPLDVVKHRMQSLDARYTSTLQCVRITMAREGPSGFYKGLLSPLVGVGAYQAVCFASFDWAVRMLDVRDRGSSSEASRTLLAGTFSGICTVFVTAPTDHVKIQMALQTEARAEAQSAKYTSSFHCARAALRSGGTRALYRGFAATMCRDVPSTTVYFASYHWTKTKLKERQQERRRRRAASGGSGELVAESVGSAEFIAGGVAGVASWASIIPLDTIKTRVQMIPIGAPRVTIVEAAREVHAQQGFASLLRGSSALLVRAFVANAATFWAYEKARLVVKESG